MHGQTQELPVDKFLREHGLGYPPLRIGEGTLMTADASIVRDNVGHPLGCAMLLPPQDNIERTRMICRFFKARLDRATSSLRAFRQAQCSGGQVAWLRDAFGDPPRHSNGRLIESLDAPIDRLEEIVKDARAKLDAASKELKRMAPDFFTVWGTV
jgi:hypothetical protein